MSKTYRILTASFVGVSCILLTSSANADAVPPPRQDCPPGSRGETCHGGPHCMLVSCRDDTDCTGNETCQSRRFCMDIVECGSRGHSRSRRVVAGSCNAGETCGENPCIAEMVCAPPPDSPMDTPPPQASPATSPHGAAPADEGRRGLTSGCVVSDASTPAAPLVAILLWLGLVGYGVIRRRKPKL